MRSRLGEEAGWIGGWIGAFLWVLIMATTPRKHPRIPFWNLMLPAYVVLGLSLAWAIRSFGTNESGLTWWSIFWALLVLIPLTTIGRRRWSDPDPKQTNAADRYKGG